VESRTDPFPVQWEDPEDAKAMWLTDEVHNLRQMRSLDFDLRLCPMLEGTTRAADFYGLPFKGTPRLIHGFVYSKIVFPDMDGDAIAAALMATDVAVRKVAAELESHWQNAWLPEIQSHLADLRAFDLGAASLDELLAHLAGVKRRLERMWELHFRLANPMMLAVSDFDEAYRDLFPDARPFDPYELLAGFPNKTIEANIRLWELGRAAARTPSLRALVVETARADLPAALARTSEGQALWREILGYLSTYGERSDDLYLDAPTWLDDPTPVLRGLRDAVLQPDRDLAAELSRQAEQREARLVQVRAQLASHPRAVRDEFEALLKAAQVATVLGEDHHFWIDTKISYHARRVSLEVGKRLVERGVLDRPDDVFDLTFAELSSLADQTSLASELRARIAERRADAARFTGATRPAFLGVPRAFPAVASALMKAGAKLNGNLMGPPSTGSELRGMPGARGKVTGPARVVRTLDEAEQRLRPGDILVAPATLPSWTPFFAIAAAVVTGVGGVLCHAAVVAREYGIPAAVGVRGATDAIRDGQTIEVDGDAGVVRLLAR
jgi:rifampicin phosphotransferase